MRRPALSFGRQDADPDSDTGASQDLIERRATSPLPAARKGINIARTRRCAANEGQRELCCRRSTRASEG